MANQNKKTTTEKMAEAAQRKQNRESKLIEELAEFLPGVDRLTRKDYDKYSSVVHKVAYGLNDPAISLDISKKAQDAIAEAGAREKIAKGSGGWGVPREHIRFDLSTTGLDSSADFVTQASAVHVKDGKVIDTFDVFFDVNQTQPEALMNAGGRGPSDSAKVTGHTSEFLAAKAKTGEALHPDAALAKLENFMNAKKRKDVPILGNNISDFEVPFLESRTKIDTKKRGVIDTGVNAKAAMMDLQPDVGETKEAFYGRIYDSYDYEKGWSLTNIAEAYDIDVAAERLAQAKKLGIDPAVHDSRLDTHIISKVADAQKAQKTARKVRKKVERKAKEVIDPKIAGRYKTAGFAVGAAAALIGYQAFGRSAADETLETVGGPKDSPITAPAIVGSGLAGLHIASPLMKDKFGINTSIADMADGAFFTKATTPNGFASKATRYGAIGLLAYSGVSMIHNVANNEDGGGMRYPILSAAIGGGTLIGISNLKARGGDIDKLKDEISTATSKTLDESGDAIQKLRAGYENMKAGKTFKGPNFKGKQLLNDTFKYVAKNVYAKAVLGVSAALVVGGTISSLTTGNAQHRNTGNNQETGYNNREQRIGYRSASQYSHPYKRSSGQSSPHGLALV